MGLEVKSSPKGLRQHVRRGYTYAKAFSLALVLPPSCFLKAEVGLSVFGPSLMVDRVTVVDDLCSQSVRPGQETCLLFTDAEVQLDRCLLLAMLYGV